MNNQYQIPMIYWRVLLMTLCTSGILFSQEKDTIPTISEIQWNQIPNGTIQKYWLALGTDSFNRPIVVPLLIAKGSKDGKVLGLTAAIHGNELNGIAIIQNIFKNLDPIRLKGAIIGIPGINPLSIFNHERRFIDEEDLNRNFPGKKNGNRSQQMAFEISEKVLSHFDFHVDMHTASFGRVNTMYGRGDMQNDTLAAMLQLQQPDIIVSNKGKPSFGSVGGETMRAAAIGKDIKSITLEYGNPQVYQPEMIMRGEKGIENLMIWLKIKDGTVEIPKVEQVCSKSYWMFTNHGGLLEVQVALNEKVTKGQRVAVLKNPFGAVLEEYYAPEDGIVIGKSTNPANISGGRIIHLGILESHKE